MKKFLCYSILLSILIIGGAILYRNHVLTFVVATISSRIPVRDFHTDGIALELGSLTANSASFKKDLATGTLSAQAEGLSLSTSLHTLYQKILGSLTIRKLGVEFNSSPPLEANKGKGTTAITFPLLHTRTIFPLQSLAVNDISLSYVRRDRTVAAQGALNIRATNEAISANFSLQNPVKAEIQFETKTSSNGVIEQVVVRLDMPTLPVAQIALSSIKAQATFSLQSEQSKLHIDSIQGKLLGGAFTIQPTNIDLDVNRCNSFTAQLSKINLSEIISHYPATGLAATGSISAHLPFRICPQGVSITQGKITTNEPGIIRYSGAEIPLTADDSAVNFVRKVLEEFHYSSLESSVDLIPKGTLSLGLKLSGHSPAVNKQQSINVNLNIEENIPALLKSLRIADELEKKYTGTKN